MATHPDIAAEQAHVDRAYRRLDDMRRTAQSMHDDVIVGTKGGTHQAREEREAMVSATLQRLSRLDIGREALCFGRIDTEEDESFHIGRLPISDVDQEPLIVDWRAPVAEPFYRATGRHPMGLRRRRHLITEGRQVVGLEDEVFDLDHVDDVALAGEGALLAALERSRSGQMRDIVATIQGEQDEIIRAPLHGVLVVQGGPGTGKTAVALHRAAYLLYTHRFPLEIQGVLVVGPNPLFMRYIEQVLPSLGETGVSMTTISGLVDQRATIDDPAAVARLKGDPRMARVVARAVRDRQRALPRTVEVGVGAHVVRITPELSADVVRMARRRPGTHNARRRQVEVQLAKRLADQLRAATERSLRTGLRGGDDIVPEVDERELLGDLRRVEAFVRAVDRMWPVLTPQELLHDLFTVPALLSSAARGVLRDGEERVLRRPRRTSFDQASWSAADLPLIDEALVLLGHARPRADRDADAIRAFGHIVVDEAQDLTPMQLRMLSRRSLAASMTVVGDIGQATGAVAPRSWDDVFAHLPRHRENRVVELTVNYRTPQEVMEVAGRVLAAAAPELTPPSSVRSTGSPPERIAVDPGAGIAALAESACREADHLRSVTGGTVAVVCPASLTAPLAAALEEGGLQRAEGADPLADRVSLVPVGTVKGLEFDGVVVVEPALIVEEVAQGLKALYVALTRCTKRVTVVHARELPEPLRSVPERVPARASAAGEEGSAG